MRIRFDEQLDELHAEVIRMGDLCEEAIASSVKCFLGEGDAKQLFEHTLDVDSQIDQAEATVKAMCMRLLLTQQPVAGDLRTVTAVLKMISDMERIGDQSSDIAELSKYVTDRTPLKKVHIRNMTVSVIGMVNDSIDAFVQKNAELAADVIARDDIVDTLFDKVKTELVELIGSGVGGECLDLLMIAKYLERIGDHATNIAELV